MPAVDAMGTAALLAALVTGAMAAASPRVAVPAARAAAAAWLVALGWLTMRFLTVDLRLIEVARLTRAEVPAPLRAAGAWAGPRGSLVCWAAVVVTVLAGAAMGRRVAVARCAGTISALVALAVLLAANPFERLVTRPDVGAGLNPVLEHPMMLIHPPLLYLAQALVVAAALVGIAEEARRWSLAAAAALVSATLLGAWWAHDELGWGGWWAWDPVENTALAPLVAVVAALHARRATNAAAVAAQCRCGGRVRHRRRPRWGSWTPCTRSPRAPRCRSPSWCSDSVPSRSRSARRPIGPRRPGCAPPPPDGSPGSGRAGCCSWSAPQRSRRSGWGRPTRGGSSMPDSSPDCVRPSAPRPSWGSSRSGCVDARRPVRSCPTSASCSSHSACSVRSARPPSSPRRTSGSGCASPVPTCGSWVRRWSRTVRT